MLPVRFACALGSLLAALLPRGRANGARTGPGAKSGASGGLQGDQLFDLLCVLIFGATLAFLRLLPAGSIYFWLKDLTQEFLKLHVVHSAVEIFDKVWWKEGGRGVPDVRRTTQSACRGAQSKKGVPRLALSRARALATCMLPAGLREAAIPAHHAGRQPL